MDFSKQIEEEVANWAPEKLRDWNNTTWAHALLMASGWGPFGEPPETAANGAWIPSKADRKNAVLLLKKALDAVHAAAVMDGKKQLAAMGISPEEIEEKFGRGAATLPNMLASFESQLAYPESPLSQTVDAYSRETFEFYIAAGKAITAWEKDADRPLSPEELDAIAPPSRKSQPTRGNRVAVFEDQPIDFPGDVKDRFRTLGGIDPGVVEALEKLKQAAITTKGLSEHGLTCGMVGCKNPPTTPCNRGCGSHYCETCWEAHKNSEHMSESGDPVQTRLPREVN